MTNIKFQTSLFALCLFLGQASANVITGVAAIPDGYYEGVSGKKGADNILNALNTCISKDYNEISYKGLEPHYLNTDFYSDTLWDMYSTCRFDYEDANKSQSQLCDGWNKEHVCCQSWLGSGPMQSDLFNVYPTDARVNNLRSNYPYGVVSGSSSGISGDPNKHALGKLGTSAKSGYSGKCYEPDDRYKGDFARTFFYMVARYRNNILNGSDGANMFTSSPTNLTTYSLSFLLEWHRNDPVSEKEVDRNQAVYGEQKNRNPFIDYPDLVEYIWGNKVGETIDLSTMVPTCESVYTTTKHGVSWSVNGEIQQVDSVRENHQPSLPDTPNSCSASSNTFVGWTNTPISGVAAEAPAVLYTSGKDMPVVTADITYYAVFAHVETEQTGAVESSESIDFSAQGYTNGAEITSLTVGEVTVTFGKGTAGSNVPKYYNTGTAVRCYPGNTMTVSANTITKIEITFGSGENSNPISVNSGTLNGTTWTGSADQVTFSVEGSSGNRRFYKLDVTMNGESSVTTYSDYLTLCDATEDIDEVETASVARKMLKDGQLIIMVGNQVFNLQGQKIK